MVSTWELLFSIVPVMGCGFTGQNNACRMLFRIPLKHPCLHMYRRRTSSRNTRIPDCNHGECHHERRPSYDHESGIPGWWPIGIQPTDSSAVFVASCPRRQTAYSAGPTCRNMRSESSDMHRKPDACAVFRSIVTVISNHWKEIEMHNTEKGRGIMFNMSR